MNVKTKLAAVTTALTLGLAAGQSFADDRFFGVPILDGAQHDYVLEHNRDGGSDEYRSSAAPFSGYGVAILDGAEHDYVFESYSDERQVSYIAQSDQDSTEFGIAILDDSIHDYVRDHDPDTLNSDLTITATTRNYGDNRGTRKQ